MFDLDSRGEILWVMVERGDWRQHVLTYEHVGIPKIWQFQQPSWGEHQKNGGRIMHS
jgi:hypothetical protein